MRIYLFIITDTTCFTHLEENAIMYIIQIAVEHFPAENTMTRQILHNLKETGISYKTRFQIH